MDGRDFIEAGITSEGSSGQQKILMKTVKIHSQYNSVTADNDISIVKLNTPLTFNNNVKNACLPESSFAPQSNAVVSGWGTTVNGMYSIINPVSFIINFSKLSKNTITQAIQM